MRCTAVAASGVCGRRGLVVLQAVVSSQKQSIGPLRISGIESFTDGGHQRGKYVLNGIVVLTTRKEQYMRTFSMGAAALALVGMLTISASAQVFFV